MFSFNRTASRRQTVLFRLQAAMADSRALDKLSVLQKFLCDYPGLSSWVDDNNFNILTYASWEGDPVLKVRLYTILLEAKASPCLMHYSSVGALLFLRGPSGQPSLWVLLNTFYFFYKNYLIFL